MRYFLRDVIASPVYDSQYIQVAFFLFSVALPPGPGGGGGYSGRRPFWREGRAPQQKQKHHGIRQVRRD